jgi:hypothetical protein
VNDPSRHEDAVTWAENALLLFYPVLEATRDYINEFFLVGVIVEVVPLSRKEGPLRSP